MNSLKTYINEGLLKGQADTIANGENDTDAALGIPKVDDFILNSSGCSVYFPCAEMMRKYRGYAWCPWNSSGLQFSIFKNRLTKKCSLTIRFCEENTKFASYYAKELKGWQYNKYIDKPIGYWKKVVISLIKHLAENPKAFTEMLDYNAEVYKDIACKQSYDDGRYMNNRGFEELLKIKG
jgi:hypothetical protein